MKFSPQLVIFDVDGVLVDVHGSFHRTIIDTVHHFTNHRPTYADIQRQVARHAPIVVEEQSRLVS